MSDPRGHWTDLFVRRPVLAIVLALLIAILGLFSFFGLQTREFPNLTNTVISIKTSYPGASPQTVQSFITQPLGRVLGQTPDLDYLTSTSSQGVSSITLYMRLNTDQANALANVQTEITQVQDQLPKDSHPPVVHVSSGSQTSLMYIALYSPDGVMTPPQIIDYTIRNVQPLLQTVNGVSQARLMPPGGSNGNTLAMRVWLNPVAMTAYDITAADVRETLQAQNVITALGTTRNALVAIPIDSNLNAEDVATFQHLVVKTVDNTPVYLNQVATVELGAQSYDAHAFFNGIPAVLIGIDTTPSANALDVSNGVNRQLEIIRRDLPVGLSLGQAFSAADFIHAAIDEVVTTIGITLGVVLIVIFLFLGSLRALVVPAIAIPLSLLGAGIFMQMFGYSLNLLTFLAFVLAIGLVVDDAIVVVENVHRHVDEGELGFVAAIRSARELTLPIIVMSTTLVAVYLPVAFAGGLTSILFTEFAFTIVFSVLISMLVALTLSPVMSGWLLRPTSARGLGHFLETTYQRLLRGYERSLENFLRYPVIGLTFTIAILASLFFLFIGVRGELSPPQNEGVVFAFGTANPNISPEQLLRDAKQVLDVYNTFPEKKYTFMVSGVNPAGAGSNGIFAGMRVYQHERTADELLAPLQQALDSHVPGLSLSTGTPPPLPGATSVLPISFVVKAPTGGYEQLEQVTRTIESKAMASRQFTFLQNDLKIDQPQYRLIVDRDLAGSLGISMSQIASTLQPLLSGAWVNRFTMQGYSYEVIPQVPDAGRADLGELNRYHVRAADGTLIPLATLVRFSTRAIPQSLPQFNGVNSATLIGIPAPGVSLSQALETLQRITLENAPKDYTIDYAGNSRQFMQQGYTFLLAIALAVILIYLLMSAQFNSFRDALIVMLTIPMSVAGALIFMSLGFATLNIYTEIALITLLGLITKQGILVVQFANQMQLEQGLGKLEAVQRAASVRLRPILMTTLAMVLGVIPLILASGAGAPPRHQLGLVIATGLGVGGLFSLYIVPVMYLYIARDHSKHATRDAEKQAMLAHLDEKH